MDVKKSTVFYFCCRLVMEVNLVGEKWTKWIPLEGIPAKLYLDKLVFDQNGTLLILKGEDENATIQVHFDGSILSLRSTDEGRRLKTINLLDAQYGRDFYTKWSFFKVINSSYVEWFNQESYDMYTTYNICHYIFLTSDDIVEILSTYEPNVLVI